MGFELSADYKQVAERIADFKAKHPDGCLRPVNPDEPYRIEAINGSFFIVYAAAAYRSPEDPLPGIGVAFEPFPGRTPYTKDSELQNAETSAWGRAIVAVLASESKAVASAEDVRNRQADSAASQEEVDQRRKDVKDAIAALNGDQTERLVEWVKHEKLPQPERLTVTQADRALAFIASLQSAPGESESSAVSAPAPVEGGQPQDAGSSPSTGTPDESPLQERKKQEAAVADQAARVTKVKGTKT